MTQSSIVPHALRKPCGERSESIRRRTILVALGLVVFAIAFIASSGNAIPASAKPTDAYTIDWYTVDGGGAMNLTGAPYTLSGTLGQPDAGTPSGNSYTLAGGFWNSELGNLLKLYLPLIMR